jgi:hypothetical protein
MESPKNGILKQQQQNVIVKQGTMHCLQYAPALDQVIVRCVYRHGWVEPI